MAHTPGPWKALALENGCEFEVVQGDPEDPWIIATAHFMEGQLQANAFLIAAAPKMYAALKAFNLDKSWIVSGNAESLTLRVPLAVIQQMAEAVREVEGR